MQSLKDGIWNLPSTVNSLLGREDQVDDHNNNATTSSGDDGDGDNGKKDADELSDNDDGMVAAIEEQDIGADSMANSLMSVEEDILDRSHAIPFGLIREQWQLVLDWDASMPEMEDAIRKCKELVLRCNDDESEEKKWLVRHLIELRYRLRELQDVDNDPDALPPETKVILGHHFVANRNNPKYKVHCDHCSGLIWNVVQASYICTDCSFAVHHKCIRNVIRICAHVITTERNLPIECICPEIGLAFQKYTCAECGSQLSCNISTGVTCFGLELKAEKLNTVVPRLCDYSGLYYCSACHWNNTSVIPARVINNWDFVPRKVGRASLQQIRLLYERPIINLEARNPRLFHFIPGLGVVKRLRARLTQMKRYLAVCRLAEEHRLVQETIGGGSRRHLMNSVDMYSVADLVGVENGTLPEFLRKTHDTFERHIRNCVICSGKAYFCEVCNNDEFLFPFDDAAIECSRCNSVTHRVCHARRACLKCARLRVREQQLRNEILDAANGN